MINKLQTEIFIMVTKRLKVRYENTSWHRIAEVNSGSSKGIFPQLNISLY